ncbi:hypothetical protein [Sporomusa sp.]|uniref:hypothetical protein n=1 Tax=Sporomusa sp. TaxID=2078658 RepID=UPI002CCE0DBA|nr:hypothetical protein [Sporomusa sp.]HWR41909.1 hypothetical protein [Sporomusa sp.]
MPDIEAHPDDEREAQSYANREARYDTNREPRYDTNREPRYDNNREPRYDAKRETRYDTNREPRYSASREARYDTTRDPRYESRYSRKQRMRELAMETSNEESVLGLEQVFEAKLAAIRIYEQRLGTITDPYARRSLQQMIRKERAELLHLAELTDLVEQSPEMTGLARTRRRVNHEVKMRTGQDMTFWLGAAVVGAVLLPSVRDKLRPLAVKAVQGVLGLTDQAQGIFSGMREDIEDLVSEAQFERFRDSLDTVVEEPVEPGGTS